MPFDIYGNNLRRGYCEVHPHVNEEYPCSLCYAEIRQEEERRRHEQKQREQHEKSLSQERIYTREEVKRIVAPLWFRAHQGPGDPSPESEYAQKVFNEWFEDTVK